MQGTLMLAAALLMAPPEVKPLPPSEIPVSRCLVTLVEEVQVPAREAGVIDALEARPGMMVNRGQELARMDESQQRLELKQAECDLQAARKQHSNDIRVRYARKAWEVSQAEVEQKEAANKRFPGTVPAAELRRLRLAAERGLLEIEQAQHDQSLSAVTVDSREAAVGLAELSIDRRQIRAPISGVVAEVHRRAGEWVNPGDPVLTIYRMDRLRVEGFLNVKHAGPEVAGCLVTATVQLPGGRSKQYPGKIVFVSPKVEPVSGEFRVWAEIENTDLRLLPGLKAQMTIHLHPQAARAAQR